MGCHSRCTRSENALRAEQQRQAPANQASMSQPVDDQSHVVRHRHRADKVNNMPRNTNEPALQYFEPDAGEQDVDRHDAAMEHQRAG